MENLGQLGRVLSRTILTPAIQTLQTVEAAHARMPIAVAAVALLCWTVPAIQAEQIQRKFSTSATPSLLLHNHIGSVSVKSWEKNEN